MAIGLWFLGFVGLVIAAAVASGRGRANPHDVAGRRVIVASALGYSGLVVAAVWLWGGSMASQGRIDRLREGATVGVTLDGIRVLDTSTRSGRDTRLATIGHGPSSTVRIPNDGLDEVARVEVDARGTVTVRVADAAGANGATSTNGATTGPTNGAANSNGPNGATTTVPANGATNSNGRNGVNVTTSPNGTNGRTSTNGTNSATNGATTTGTTDSAATSDGKRARLIAVVGRESPIARAAHVCEKTAPATARAFELPVATTAVVVECDGERAVAGIVVRRDARGVIGTPLIAERGRLVVERRSLRSGDALRIGSATDPIPNLVTWEITAPAGTSAMLAIPLDPSDCAAWATAPHAARPVGQSCAVTAGAFELTATPLVPDADAVIRRAAIAAIAIGAPALLLLVVLALSPRHARKARVLGRVLRVCVLGAGLVALVCWRLVWAHRIDAMHDFARLVRDNELAVIAIGAALAGSAMLALDALESRSLVTRIAAALVGWGAWLAGCVFVTGIQPPLTYVGIGVIGLSAIAALTPVLAELASRTVGRVGPEIALLAIAGAALAARSVGARGALVKLGLAYATVLAGHAAIRALLTRRDVRRRPAGATGESTSHDAVITPVNTAVTRSEDADDERDDAARNTIVMDRNGAADIHATRDTDGSEASADSRARDTIVNRPIEGDDIGVARGTNLDDADADSGHTIASRRLVRVDADDNANGRDTGHAARDTIANDATDDVRDTIVNRAIEDDNVAVARDTNVTDSRRTVASRRLVRSNDANGGDTNNEQPHRTLRGDANDADDLHDDADDESRPTWPGDDANADEPRPTSGGDANDDAYDDRPDGEQLRRPLRDDSNVGIEDSLPVARWRYGLRRAVQAPPTWARDIAHRALILGSLVAAVGAVALLDAGVTLAIVGVGLALAMLVAGHDAMYDASQSGRLGLLEREHARLLVAHGVAAAGLAVGVATAVMLASDRELLESGVLAVLHAPLVAVGLFGIAAAIARTHRRSWAPWLAAALAALAVWGMRDAMLQRATAGDGVASRRVAAVVEPGYALLRDDQAFVANATAWREAAVTTNVDTLRGQGYFGARIRDTGVMRSIENDYLPVLIARESGVGGLMQSVLLLLALVVGAGAIGSLRLPHASRAQRARWLVTGVAAAVVVYQPLAALGILPLTGITWPGLGIDSPGDLWLFVIGGVWCLLGAEQPASSPRASDERVRRAPRVARARRIVLVALVLVGLCAVVVVARGGAVALSRAGDDDERVTTALRYASSLACAATDTSGASFDEAIPAVVAGKPTDGATARFEREVIGKWRTEREALLKALEKQSPVKAAALDAVDDDFSDAVAPRSSGPVIQVGESGARPAFGNATLVRIGEPTRPGADTSSSDPKRTKAGTKRDPKTGKNDADDKTKRTTRDSTTKPNTTADKSGGTSTRDAKADNDKTTDAGVKSGGDKTARDAKTTDSGAKSGGDKSARDAKRTDSGAKGGGDKTSTRDARKTDADPKSGTGGTKKNGAKGGTTDKGDASKRESKGDKTKIGKSNKTDANVRDADTEDDSPAKPDDVLSRVLALFNLERALAEPMRCPKNVGSWRFTSSGDACVATLSLGWPDVKLTLRRDDAGVQARCAVALPDEAVSALRTTTRTPRQRIRVVSAPIGASVDDVGEVVMGSRIVRLRVGAAKLDVAAVAPGVHVAGELTIGDAKLVVRESPKGVVLHGAAELFVADAEHGGDEHGAAWRKTVHAGEVALDRISLISSGPTERRVVALFRSPRGWAGAAPVVDSLVGDTAGDRTHRLYPHGAAIPELGWVNPYDVDRSLGLDGWIHAYAAKPKHDAAPACGTLAPPPIAADRVCSKSPLDGVLECRVALQPQLALALRELAGKILVDPKPYTGRAVSPVRVGFVALRGDTGEILAQGNLAAGRPALAYAPIDARAEAELVKLRGEAGEADVERVDWNLPIAVGSTLKPIVARAAEQAFPTQLATMSLTAAGHATGCRRRRGVAVDPIVGHCPPTTLMSVVGTPTTADLYEFLAKSPNWYQAALGLIGLGIAPDAKLFVKDQPVTLVDIAGSDLGTWPTESALTIADAQGPILGRRNVTIAGLRRTPMWTRMEALLGRPLCTLGDRASCERAASRADVCAARGLPIAAPGADLRNLVALGPDRIDLYASDRKAQTTVPVREYLQLLRGSGVHSLGSLAQITDAFGRVVYDASPTPKLAASWFPAPATGVVPAWSCAKAIGRANTVLGADGGLCGVVREGGTGALVMKELAADPNIVIYGAKTGTIDSLADIARNPKACARWNSTHVAAARLECGKAPLDDSLFVIAFGVVTPHGTIPITLGIQLQRAGKSGATKAVSSFVRAIATYLRG